MIRKFLTTIILFFCVATLDVAAQIFTPRLPIYIVNGVKMSEQEVKAIDPEDIVDNQLLPADEHTIQKYGQEASNGVVLITLRYDTPACYIVDGEEQNFSSYVASQVEWKEPNPTARVILSFRINEDGSVTTANKFPTSTQRLVRDISWIAKG